MFQKPIPPSCVVHLVWSFCFVVLHICSSNFRLEGLNILKCNYEIRSQQSGLPILCHLAHSGYVERIHQTINSTWVLVMLRATYSYKHGVRKCPRRIYYVSPATSPIPFE